MRISVLTIGAVASMLSINSVFATTSTVTSKDYVDAADALKQDKIPVAETNIETPGVSVVTYTDTAGVIGERGIYDGGKFGKDDDRLTTVYGVEEMIDTMSPTGTANTVVMYKNDGNIGGERGIYDGSTTYDSSTDADKLVTASVVQNVSNNLPTVTTSKMTCVDAPDCTLWTVADRTVYGSCIGGQQSCGTSAAECSGLCCPGLGIGCIGTNCLCISGDGSGR